MGTEYKTIQFASLLSEPLRNGIYKAKEFHGRGAKIVNMGELFANPRLRSVSMRRLELSNSEARRFDVRPGDLLFARRSLVAEGAGKCSVVLEVDEPTVFESSIIRARPDADKADSLFLYYFFNSHPGMHALDTIRRHVAVAGITGTDLAGLEFPVPPIPEQRAIAHILGTLDEKIELNRRMNETLEAITRALFKSWFVDFGPVRAKAEGRDPGLPPDVAALFPDRFENSQLGEIPAGWKIATVDEEYKLTMGQSPPGNTYNETGEGLPFYQGRVDFGFRFPARRVYCSAPTRIAEEGDTLVTVRAPVGDINMARERSCVGRGVAAIRHKTGARSYTYYSMLAHRGNFALFEAEGTVFGSIGKKDFHNIVCVVPPPEVIAAFEAQASPLDDKIRCNERGTETLIALRDALQPKLISGELQVRAAERSVAAAV